MSWQGMSNGSQLNDGICTAKTIADKQHTLMTSYWQLAKSVKQPLSVNREVSGLLPPAIRSALPKKWIEKELMIS
jgi:hypothetical protein